MTRNKNKHNHKNKHPSHHAGNPVIGPAPFLKKERVVLYDIKPIASAVSNGDVVPILSGNGYVVGPGNREVP